MWVAVYSWTHVPCVSSGHHHVKAESSQTIEGFPQSFLSAKPKKAAAGKENHARFDFVNETKAETLGSSPLFTC